MTEYVSPSINHATLVKRLIFLQTLINNICEPYKSETIQALDNFKHQMINAGLSEGIYFIAIEIANDLISKSSTDEEDIIAAITTFNTQQKS